jgi:hypothetical protein
VGVQVGMAFRDDIDDREGHSFLEEAGTLDDEVAAVLGPVLVGGADQLHGSHEALVPAFVEDKDLKSISCRKIDRESLDGTGGAHVAVATPFPLPAAAPSVPSSSRAATSISTSVPRWTRGSA